MSEEDQVVNNEDHLVNNEEKARNLGWKPEDEWRGDPPPNGFVDADTFIERGEKVQGILKENNEKLQNELHEVKRSVTEMKDMYRQRDREMQQRAYDAAYQRLVAEQAKAIETADSDTFIKAEGQKRQLENQRTQAQQQEYTWYQQKSQQEQYGQQQQEIYSLTNKFEQENPWFKADFALADTAERAARFIQKNNPQITPAQLLVEMKAAVVKAHPDNPAFRNDSAPSMDGGGNRPRATIKGGWQALPSEAKDAFKRYTAQGLYSDDAAGRKEYLELYGE